jgi:hypothetical protein
MPRKSQEDLDDLVDELDELELEEDTVEDDPDEAPAKRTRTRKTKAAKTEKKEKAGIGTKEVAEAAGIEPRQLRMFLRSAGYQPKDDRDGRYSWKSLNDPEVKEIVKKIKAGAVDKLNKEKVTELKGRRSKKAAVAVEEDDE